MTRDACLSDPLLLVLLVASNLAIAAAYFAIPATMAWIAIRAKRVPFPAIGALFGGFILSCGGTHLAAALVFFRPAWFLEAAVCCFTAVISIAGARMTIAEWAQIAGAVAALLASGGWAARLGLRAAEQRKLLAEARLAERPLLGAWSRHLPSPSGARLSWPFGKRSPVSGRNATRSECVSRRPRSGKSRWRSAFVRRCGTSRT